MRVPAALFTGVALSSALLLQACEDDDDGPPFIPPVNVRPEAVTDLEATATDLTVTLRWTAPQDGEASAQASIVGSGRTSHTSESVVSYDIRYAAVRLTDESWEKAVPVDSIPTPSSPGSEETLFVSAIEPGTYFFAVRSMDSDSAWSALSNQPSISLIAVDDHAPDAIEDLAAALDASTTVRLTWTAPDDSLGNLASYVGRSALVEVTDVNWDTATSLPDPPAPLFPGSIQTWTVGGYAKPGTYYFALRAIDDSGNVSLLSNVARVTPLPDLTPPQAVRDLVVTRAGSDSAVVMWTATGNDGVVGRAAAYDLRWSVSEITSANWEQAVPATAPPRPSLSGQRERYVFRGLPSETRIWLALRSSDDAGNVSELSNVVFLDTEAETIPPARITNLEATDVSSFELTLRWTAPGDDGNVGRAARYDLRSAAVPIDPALFDSYSSRSAPAPQEAGSAEALHIDGLFEGPLYFAIRAIDDVGNAGDVSNIVRVDVPGDDIAPDAISDLAVLRADPDRVLLTWTAPADRGPTGRAADYEIRYGSSTLNDENWDLATAAVGAPVPSEAGEREEFAVLGLEPSTTYFIGIRATDDADNHSSLSNIATARTPATTGVLLVRPDGEGLYPTIQAALDVATAGQAIELEDGVFRGPGNRELLFPEVPVYLRSQSRDPGGCFIDCEAGDTEECSAISGASPLASGTFIEGITFRGGRKQDGAAIQLRDSPAVTVRRCRFLENRVLDPFRPGTSAIDEIGSHLTMEDCVLTENVGEPIRLDAASGLNLIHCDFLANPAAESCGIFSAGGQVYVYECQITGAVVPDPYSSNGGSAIFCAGGTLEIRGAWIHDFQSFGWLLSPLSLTAGATAVVSDVFIWSIVASYFPGVVSVRDSRLTLDRGTFDIDAPYNLGVGGPAVMSALRSTVEIRDTDFGLVSTSNIDGPVWVAEFESSEVLIESSNSSGTLVNDPTPPTGSNFLFTGASDVVLRTSTFTQGGPEGGPDGWRGQSIVRFEGRSLTIERCIFFGNPRGPAIESHADRTSITCTDIYGNYSIPWDGGEPTPLNWPDWMAALVGVNGNLEVDPRFCDPDHLDYRLLPESPVASPPCGRMGALEIGCE